MVNILFINACVLVTFLYLTGLLSTKYVYSLEAPSLRVQLVSGTMFGMYGIILMHYSFPINDEVISDLRHLAIVIVAGYVGWLPSLISGVLITAGRIVLFGLSQVSIIAGAGMLVIAVLCALIALHTGKRLQKLLIMNLISIIVISIVLTINVHELLLEVVAIYLSISTAATLVIYALLEYSLASNRLFARMTLQAQTDHLTSLHNLRQFELLLNQHFRQARRSQEPLGVIALDIDHFKKINDTYGHAAGDVVLKQLSSLLKLHARPTDEVSRNGGEEFTVLVPRLASHEVTLLADKIRRAVEQHVFMLGDGTALKVTVSAGVAVYPDTLKCDDVQELLHQADEELYRAKQEGRNRVCTGSAQA
ncbi:diguanylate cyclase [Paenibacillus sp. JSM ZJ436]|uniref:diguanylate cyclase n=1 Tax=Paenibacillus sp. JSM ZJ436 TaxID=3376190 RepID=UPI003795EBA9